MNIDSASAPQATPESREPLPEPNVTSPSGPDTRVPVDVSLEGIEGPSVEKVREVSLVEAPLVIAIRSGVAKGSGHDDHVLGGIPKSRHPRSGIVEMLDRLQADDHGPGPRKWLMEVMDEERHVGVSIGGDLNPFRREVAAMKRADRCTFTLQHSEPVANRASCVEEVTPQVAQMEHVGQLPVILGAPAIWKAAEFVIPTHSSHGVRRRQSLHVVMVPSGHADTEIGGVRQDA